MLATPSFAPKTAQRTLLAGFLLLVLGLVSPAVAQRFSFLDSQYILEQMPEYQSVQQELEDQSSQWQREVEEKQGKIKEKFDDYQARRPLLSPEEQQKIQNEIQEMERELAELRSKRFGYDGDLYKLREEKMRPIQDRLLQAIEDVAKEKRSDVVFDRASTGAVLIYTNEQYDISNDVLKQMGITPTASGPNDPNAAPADSGR